MPYTKLGIDKNNLLNKDTDEQLECVGYEYVFWKRLCVYSLAIVTLGFPLLCMRWKPEWSVWLRCTTCPLFRADVVLLKDLHDHYFVHQVSKESHEKFPADYIQYFVHGETGTDRSRLTISQRRMLKYFHHHNTKYVWDEKAASFVPLRGFDKDTLCVDFMHKFSGWTDEQQSQRLVLYGENSIDIPVKSYHSLLIEEVLNPFYIFQIFSIALWSSDDYYYFAACIFLVSTISISVSLYKTRKQSETLHEMVAISTAKTVTVVRHEGEVEEIPSARLVPGDVIQIPAHGCTMVCDAVLVAGTCIVNESMLTGESVPVLKPALSFDDAEDVYSPETHKRHTLFSGTKVIQTRYYGDGTVTAVVVRTGFSTAKGELVRSILFPKPMGFKFYKDSMRFVGILGCLALLGMAYGTYVFIRRGASVGFIVKRILDIVTIVVPPALPAAMTVGSVYAQGRLKKVGIFCISPPRINVCGKLKLVCFDKTGTLTEEGLDLSGVLPVHESNFLHLVLDPSDLPQRSLLLAAMATCHSLTVIKGELTGDPLDLKMFESTKWMLAEVGQERSRFDMLTPTIVKPVTKDTYFETSFSFDDLAETELKVPYEIGIVKQFPFSSTLQLMSVVTRTLGRSRMDLFVKGSPEKIATLCIPESLPANFNERLHEYAVKGFRIIALAWKPLDRTHTWHHIQRMKRDTLECDLYILGLLIMQNTLKRETTPVIRVLREANIRVVMVTGDNIHTAVSVARDCEMIPSKHQILLLNAHQPEGETPARLEVECAQEIVPPTDTLTVSDSTTVIIDPHVDVNSRYHYAINGKSFAVIRQYFPEVLLGLLVRGTVFARMSPDQKAQLVELLQEQNYIVGMCGDGANDCGALKAAHVGISLSDSEASVAAPFTSKVQNIECVPSVIREGRCALVTSFSVFKYMALYSIIQFISVLILYTYQTSLADTQFLYIDLAITASMAVFMGYIGPHKVLGPQRPTGSLLGASVMVSIFSQIVAASLVQMAAFFYLKSQHWFSPVEPEADTKFTICYETSVIFCVSCYQYLIIAVVFSRGKPFREPLYKNVPLMLSFVILIVFSTLLLLFPGPLLSHFFSLMHRQGWDGVQFRLTLLIFPFVNLIAAVAIEIFVESRQFKDVSHTASCKKGPKNRYKVMEREMDTMPEWSRVGHITYTCVTT